MELEHDRAAYEEMQATFQIVAIHILNRILQENDVEDPKLRQQICEQHAEAFGSMVDQGWFRAKPEDNRVYPFLTFAKRKAWSNMNVGDVISVLGPKADETSQLCETFSESVEWYFDENSENLTPGIEAGETHQEDENGEAPFWLGP